MRVRSLRYAYIRLGIPVIIEWKWSEFILIQHKEVTEERMRGFIKNKRVKRNVRELLWGYDEESSLLPLI